MALIIAGYYGFGNAGDELILLSLIRRFRRGQPRLAITVFSRDPAKTSRDLNVQAVNRWNPFRWIRPLMRADRLVLGGGGLLQESTGSLNHFYYLSIVLVAKLFGCRTEAIAMGIDPIRNPLNRLGTRLVVNHALDFISVRDAESREALIDSGVRRTIDIEDDPVFDLKGSPSDLPHAIGLALSPRKTIPDWPRQAALFCDEVSERLHRPVDLLVFFPAEDLAFAQEVARRSSAVVRIRIPQQPEDLLSWLPNYRLVVSTRFHALVLAAANSIPFVGWGAQHKVAALCRARRQPYFNIDQAWVLGNEVERACAGVASSEKSVILGTRSG